jgi:hypothetical protein
VIDGLLAVLDKVAVARGLAHAYDTQAANA